MFKYHFHLGSEDCRAVISSPVAMPHLTMGAEAFVLSGDQATTPYTLWKIERIVSVIHQDAEGQIVRNDIHLHCSETEGIPQT